MPASTSTRRKPTGSSSRSTCSRRSAERVPSTAGMASASSCRLIRSARPAVIDHPRVARPARAGIGLMVRPGQGRLLGTARSSAAAGRRFSTTIRSTRAQGPIPDLGLPRVRRGGCSRAENARCIHSSPRTTRTRLAAVHEARRRRRAARSLRVPVPARHWASRSTRPSCDPCTTAVSIVPAASTHRWGTHETLLALPRCAGCSRTAPTRSFRCIASPTTRCRSTRLVEDPVDARGSRE